MWDTRRSIEGEALKIELTAADLPYVERVGLCGSCGDLLASKNPDTLLCQGCCCRLIVMARFKGGAEMTKHDERMELARRIARHEPPIRAPRVDKTLLIQTARRLQRSKDVLLGLPVNKRIQ
jgi:hypothetical protein